MLNIDLHLANSSQPGAAVDQRAQRTRHVGLLISAPTYEIASGINQDKSPLTIWLADDTNDQPWNALASFKVDPTWKEHVKNAETSSAAKGQSSSIDREGK